MTQILTITRSELEEAEAIQARMSTDRVVIINGPMTFLSSLALTAIGVCPLPADTHVWTWLIGAVVTASFGLAALLVVCR